MQNLKPHLFGLIGKPVKHSFSKKYFSEKFEDLKLPNHRYELFELSEIGEFTQLLKEQPHLKGLNVTLPYKKQVIPFLDELSPEAQRIGAINTILIKESGYYGYNTDYFGFKNSLLTWLGHYRPPQALVLGQGGASAAVLAALEDLNIPTLIVTRNPAPPAITYSMLSEKSLADYPLIVNTTPVGMAPEIEATPPINLEQLDQRHYIYDLVYNPLETQLMKVGLQQGAQVKNGLEMLHLQAEKAWEIWTA